MLQHIEAWIFAPGTVRVVYAYEEKRNKCILELVLGPEPTEGGPTKQQWDLANELLDLDTGIDFRRQAFHPGCVAMDALREVGALTSAYHQILLQGFSRLHNVSPASLKRHADEYNEIDSPLIQMTSADKSPAVRAVRELCDIMETGRTGSSSSSATGRLNGWLCLLQERMASRVQLPGESAEACRQRTFQRLRQDWQCMTPADRAHYTLQAKTHNRHVAASTALTRETAQSSEPEQHQVASEVSENALVVTCPSATSRGVDFVAPFQGTGAMGVGDHAFAVSRNCVRRVQQEEAAARGTCKHFVLNMDTAWRTRSRGRVGEAAEFKHTTAMSCHEEFKCAMCGSKFKNIMMQEKLSEQLLAFVIEYRKKFVVNGRNAGPNCLIQQPLLVIKPESPLVSSCGWSRES
ncbi:unnamed protein product [Symbiodinium microadriaticum]|nr:unnamed protein product [Symbiodinium sp. KB8]CAE7246293.1 unnamed protein product [Symbiodinium microadriaticum]